MKQVIVKNSIRRMGTSLSLVPRYFPVEVTKYYGGKNLVGNCVVFTKLDIAGKGAFWYPVVLDHPWDTSYSDLGRKNLRDAIEDFMYNNNYGTKRQVFEFETFAELLKWLDK